MGQMLQSNVASRSHTMCSGRFFRIHAPYVKVAKVSAPAAFLTAMLPRRAQSVAYSIFFCLGAQNAPLHLPGSYWS